jgi:hypothetical protein
MPRKYVHNISSNTGSRYMLHYVNVIWNASEVQRGYVESNVGAENTTIFKFYG